MFKVSVLYFFIYPQVDLTEINVCYIVLLQHNIMKKTILTGDRPTGPLHLGHYFGSLQNRVKLQDDYIQFIIIADVQALTDNYDDSLKVKRNVSELVLDYLAVGIDPHKSTIFVQSQISELAELTMYFMNLVKLNHLQGNPTIKEEMKQKKMEDNIPMGFLVYPVSQAADILGFKATVIPVGSDQLPMIEQTNDIARTFNHLYGQVFETVEPVLSSISRLPGIDGQMKMSKSLNNAIYLSDNFETIRKKVMSMYTDPNHIRTSDPGNVEGNIVFSYLDIFDPNKEEVSKLKKQYKHGGLGDVEVKNRLINILEQFISPIREKRNELSKDMQMVENILKDGTELAREKVMITMKEVKTAMGINYFF